MARAQAAPGKTSAAPATASLARPSPRPSRDAGVKVTPVDPAGLAPVVIRPRAQPSVHAPPPPVAQPPAFAIRKGSAPDRLILAHRLANPAWEINSRAPLMIHLSTPDGTSVEPSVITRSDWPKGATELELKLSGSPQALASIRVVGGAAYTICELKTKECRKTRSRIDYSPVAAR